MVLVLVAAIMGNSCCLLNRRNNNTITNTTNSLIKIEWNKEILLPVAPFIAQIMLIEIQATQTQPLIKPCLVLGIVTYWYW